MVNNHLSAPRRMSRRGFMFLSAKGVTWLTVVGGLTPFSALASKSNVNTLSLRFFDPKDVPILQLILPGFVTDKNELTPDSIREGIARLDAVMTQIHPSVQDEIRLMMTLLHVTPARWVFGMFDSWDSISQQEVAKAIEGWKTSWLPPLRMAYGSLGKMMRYCWYSTDAGRNHCQYPGPPSQIMPFLHRG